MKVSILKRLKAVEIKAKKGHEAPPLIMIHFDDRKQKWVISPKWPDQLQHKSEAMYSEEVDRLQDYYFPAEFTGRVILDTFASPDPDIFGNLFCFNADEWREGKAGAFCIEKIVDIDGSRPPKADIVIGRKDGQNV